MVLPAGVCRVPQRWVSWATSSRPRPPSSRARARRRCGAVLLASETSQMSVSVADQPQLDRRGAVPDGVGDQLADHQFGGERRARLSPQAASWPAASFRARGDHGRVGGDVPGGDAGRRARARVRATQQGDVVGGPVGQQGVDHGVAGVLQRRWPGAASASAQPGQALRRCRGRGTRSGRRCTGPAGCPRAGRARWSRTAGRPARAAGRPGVGGSLRGAVGGDQDGRRMAGRGQRAAPGDRVVDRVQAGGAQLAGAGLAALRDAGLLVGRRGGRPGRRGG